MYKGGHICIVCKKEINVLDIDRHMIGVDNPYINIWLHESCYQSIKEYIEPFLRENLLEYIKETKFVQKKK